MSQGRLIDESRDRILSKKRPKILVYIILFVLNVNCQFFACILSTYIFNLRWGERFEGGFKYGESVQTM